jgi:hypothetical protein
MVARKTNKIRETGGGAGIETRRERCNEQGKQEVEES